ncbi:hypothetical protein E2C01_101372 [Portunus trituberculatus]|uniref:Uncharacterized protein n=1 Tax=Portunus trituberculatus TaxID=210409 RepID=A0A5B7KEL5_PORTR|nr:hypothetical protein [Portunus trituberculatus]
MGTNSGGLPPTCPLPVQQVVLMGIRTMVVGASTKAGRETGGKTGVQTRKASQIVWCE